MCVDQAPSTVAKNMRKKIVLRDGFAESGKIGERCVRRKRENHQHGTDRYVVEPAAPSDRSEIDRYFDAGFTFRGPLAPRPEDVIGLAVAYGRISPDAAANDHAFAAINGVLSKIARPPPV